MTLDTKKVRKFWDAQAQKARNLSLESISNLEENEVLLKKKISAEKAKVLPLVDLPIGGRVIDLGSGAGQWSFRFSRLAREVVSVEYSQAMMDIARGEADRLGIKNINFVCCPAQEFKSSKKFDLIFMSGLLIYLNDSDCEILADKCLKLSKPGTQVILRDGTGIDDRFEIRGQFSNELNAHYSATYRTAKQYIDLFQGAGFQLMEQSDMFENGSPLNKRLETRLRIYHFKPLEKHLAL